MFYLNSTLNVGIPPVLVFQLEFYYEVDRIKKLNAMILKVLKVCEDNKLILMTVCDMLTRQMMMNHQYIANMHYNRSFGQ